MQTEDRFLSVVWAPEWTPGVALLKLKYETTMIDGEPEHLKLPHSFTKYEQYVQWLRDRNIGAELPWGDRAYLVKHEDIQNRLQRVPLNAIDLTRQEIPPDALDPLLQCLEQAGIETSRAFLTCSWIASMARPDSDFDVAIEADIKQMSAIRGVIRRKIGSFEFLPPMNSSTWKRLCSCGKDSEKLVSEGRFLETFCVKSAGTAAQISIIYLRSKNDIVFASAPEEQAEVIDISGTVICDDESNYKPSRYVLRDADGNETSVICWHKWGGLVKNGDRVRITCARVESDKVIYLQMDPEKHVIRWLNW
ncbi:hypothetical protein GF413_05770 [Candidatus Micrarchaeota archaeon]|nr:hypothetical protein [Candidatus Micrarchaeota archaeon]